MDPISTPLLISVLGTFTTTLIADACRDHLKDKLKSVFSWMEKIGERERNDMEFNCQSAMEDAYAVCLEMLLTNIKASGYSDKELKEYGKSLKSFIKDKTVAEQLLESIRHPNQEDRPSPDILRQRWEQTGGMALPDDALWNTALAAFRRQAKKNAFINKESRDLMNAENIDKLRELIDRQGGVKTPVRKDKYSLRMQARFSPVDLANLMPAYADDPGRMVIRDVFVAQNVRENPPPVEIPKDMIRGLREKISGKTREKKGNSGPEDDDDHEIMDPRQLEKLRAAHADQPSRPILDIVADPSRRLLVLIGEPGSGKSTLMRYLLTGVIEPPLDPESGAAAAPLPWTKPFADGFPLLIELREFYALRQNGDFDDFLGYVAHMGKTEHWFIDDHSAHEYLKNGPSLVMFDGLDEIFDNGDRQRITHKIAGFAQLYPKAKIIVTSRPVGYEKQTLQNAKFDHFGIQDLDGEQIKTFIRGWFALVFPHRPNQADQRIERVLNSTQNSASIRLLAGNPMLLTIMALLAREEELPRERAKFYEKAVEVLCHHWDANRNLGLPEDKYLNADDKKKLLRRVAMGMQTGKGGLRGNMIQEDDLEKEIQTFLMEENWESCLAGSKKAARRMIQQLRERNYILCLRGPRLYGFVHRTFLEYLTAAQYVHLFNFDKSLTEKKLIDLFDERCRDHEWREVLRLICGQVNEMSAGRIIKRLATRTDMDAWDKKTPLPELALAIECLSEVRNVGRISDAGSALMRAVVACFLRGRDLPYDFIEKLVTAAREIGARWPGKEAFVFSGQFSISNNVTIEARWPHFLAAVFRKWDWMERLALCENEWTRLGSIEALAKTWSDQQTRDLIHTRAVEDKEYFIRTAALKALAKTWPDQKTRDLIHARAVQDENDDPRTAALEALAKTWPDQKTRDLLHSRAVEDEDDSTRRAALEALAKTWPDQKTRDLLHARAVQDENNSTRTAALEALAKTWPDQKTRDLLHARAPEDGFITSLLGKQFSEFGKIIFTKDLDGISPWLDPTKPIPQDHIKKAAKKTNIPPHKIDETVQALSKHMGWDITKGSATPQNDPIKP